MLKFDGVFGAYPPAIAASGAGSQVVQKRSALIAVHIIQRRRRTIFDTRQTSGASLVDFKIGHFLSHRGQKAL